MATTRGTKSATKTAAENQKAAAKRTSTKAATAEQVNADTDASAAYGNANTETQKAAAGFAQSGHDPSAVADPSLRKSVQVRLSRQEEAVAEQRRVAEEAAKQVREQQGAEAESTTHVMNELEAPLRAPTDNAYQKPAAPAQVGVHPDVTSPTNLMASEVPALPGTGVADPRDLAPGQDMSPSPPVSSSNILPQPDKPGTPFSKL